MVGQCLLDEIAAEGEYHNGRHNTERYRSKNKPVQVLSPVSQGRPYSHTV